MQSTYICVSCGSRSYHCLLHGLHFSQLTIIFWPIALQKEDEGIQMAMHGGMNSWALTTLIYMWQLSTKKKIKVTLRFAYLDSICDKCKCIHFWGGQYITAKIFISLKVFLPEHSSDTASLGSPCVQHWQHNTEPTSHCLRRRPHWHWTPEAGTPCPWIPP